MTGILLPLVLAAAQAQAPAEPPPAAPAPEGVPAPPARASPPPSSAPAAPVLALRVAEESALERQPQLAQARATTEASSARADQARAPLLPEIGGTAAYQRTTGNFVSRPGALPTTVGTPARASWATTDYYSLGATASQLLWDFGQASGRWRSARALESAQRDGERATEAQVLLGVRTAFFTARAQRDLVRVARETLANQEAHLRQVEGFVRAGTRPEVDLWQARTDRANAQVQLIVAENTSTFARAQLNQAMGVDGSTDYEVGDDTLPPVEGEEGALDALAAEAERARPDLAALDAQVRAQDLAASAAQGAYGPALGISTGFTDAGPRIGSAVWNWSATATLTWTIFQGGLTHAQVREARANGAAARAQADALRLQIRVDVDQARLAVRAASASIGAANEALVAARERLRQTERRYQLGVGSLVELGDAQLAVTAAAAQLVQAQFVLSTSRAQLLRALGREVLRG